MTLSRRATLQAATAAVAVAGLTLAAGIAEAQERHPRIREAIRALRGARDDLQHAAHDFGGHRDDAIRDCDRAVDQLEACLKYP
jgi:hypothetical protein